MDGWIDGSSSLPRKIKGTVLTVSQFQCVQGEYWIGIWIRLIRKWFAEDQLVSVLQEKVHEKGEVETRLMQVESELRSVRQVVVDQNIQVSVCMMKVIMKSYLFCFLKYRLLEHGRVCCEKSKE